MAALRKNRRAAASPADNAPAVPRSPQEMPALFALLGKDRKEQTGNKASGPTLHVGASVSLTTCSKQGQEMATI